MFRLCIFLVLVGWPLPSWAGMEVTPSEVYAEAVRIEKEVNLIKDHLGITAVKTVVPTRMQFLPRHSWQIGYLILSKINFFRQQQGFPVLVPNNLNPVLELEPVVVYEQTQRILMELGLVKKRLGIGGEVPPQEVIPGKKPLDVVNKLLSISGQWDIINQGKLTPKDSYAEVKRLSDDVGIILNHLKIQDTAFPPAQKPDTKPIDSLASAYVVLTEVQRLQQQASIPRVDFEPFRKTTEIEAEDVINLVILIVAELQTIKASLGLFADLTPPARKHRDKSPGDVNQLLGYIANRLRLIHNL